MSKPRSIESMYPDPKARRAADDHIDKLSNDLSMAEYLKAWDQAYFEAGGRPGKL